MDYAMAYTSLAHTYGNLTSFVTEYIKQLFPKNYFKTIHVSSAIAYKQFNIFQNTNREFLKKHKPMLIIRPRIETNDTDNFLYGTYLTQRITDQYMDLDFSNLQPFIEDDEKQIYMKFLLNRLNISFDVTIITETQIEQINQYTFFKNRVRQDHNFMIQTALESYVPKELLGVLSKDVNIPMIDSNGSVKTFLDYLNSHSYYPVTYKLKNSTGKDEFFRYYPVNVDSLFTGLQIDDGSKKGFISDAFTINFTLTTEFNGAGLYYYFTTNSDVITEIDMSILHDDKKIIPLFTISNLFNQQLPDGWNLYTSSMYVITDTTKPDVTDFSSLLNGSVSDVIKYHKEKGIPLETFIKVSVMKDNTLLDPLNGDFSVDWDNFILTTNRLNLASTYRIMIHVNTLYVNELIKSVYGFRDDK